jgi:hypothetical protein
VFRVIIILLILLGAATYFPQTRPYVQAVLGPVITPVLTWQTHGEMDRIARELESIHRQGQDLPTAGARFQNWMERQFMGGARTDAWGIDYSLRESRGSLAIVSNGPDREIGTPDDLEVTLSIRLERRRLRN